MLASSKEGLAAFDEMLLGACVRMRPPEKLDLAEWSDKYGMLSSEGSARPGKFYVSEAEYQREPMQVLSPATPWQEVVLMWGSQLGKTQILLMLAGYHIHHDPAPILFIEPSEDLCKVISNDRIGPMIRDTPVLKEIFAQNKGKKDTMHMPFPGGQLTMGWASSPSQMASRPIRILITDEEGRYGPNMEGDAVDQGKKRLATFPNRKHARVSSPALRKTCGITKAFYDSDQRYYHVACPQCGYMQALRWEQMKWPPGQPELAYYVCEANGCEITETDKYAMIRNGKWIASNPGTRTAGFHLSALYSTIGYTWGEIAADYLKCQGLPDKLRVFTNTVLSLPWDEQAEGADLSEVEKHAEEYEAQAPEWVVVVTCGADVQKDRIEATKWGWGLDCVSGVLEHRIFYGDPEKDPDVYRQFEAWRRMPVQHASGVTIPVACTFMDSGDGNRTRSVYAYTKKHERFGVRACKGSSIAGAPIVDRGKRVGKERALLVMVGVSTVKDTIYSRLQIDDRSRPGYIHFPKHPASGCDSAFFSQMTAEALVTHQTRGGEIARWEKQRPRNEALDCAVYALAAFEFTRAPLETLARKLKAAAERLQAKGEIVTVVRPEELPVPSATPASSASQESSQGSVSLAPAVLRRKRRKSFRLPGFDWIRGS